MKKLYFLIFLWIAFGFVMQSQPKFDSKGRDFWLTFLPNFHNNIENLDPEMKYGDSLYIFINSETVATGKIDYIDRFGIKRTQNFSISDPTKIYTFKLGFYDYELWGFNYSSQAWSNFQSDKLAPQSFHIESDAEITVYAHNQAVTTSDAFLVLPTDVLGTEYYIMSYYSDGRLELNELSRTPSQFAIVATEDNTTVTIKTEIASYLFTEGTRTIKLDKGNSYLVQARFDDKFQSPDLTGSYIISDKPVAVFGGHQRSTIPITTSQSNPSRDCIIEQMPPVTTWGKNAFVVPPREPNDLNSTKGSLYRVLASRDSTIVTVNGIFVKLLQAGKYYEGLLDSPKEVITSHPSLVAVYKYSAGSANATLPLGDPFMMLIPPKEQFLKTCKVNNIQTWEKNQGDNQFYPVYLEQYITIVSKSTELDSIYVDNMYINPGDFAPVASSGYSYANIPVEDGTHQITSKSEMGVYIYGYGRANSFGYIGGMDFKKINSEPLKIVQNDSCFFSVANVSTGDTSIKITEFKYYTDSTTNVVVTISDFSDSSSSSAEIRLVNYRLDGQTKLYAKDSENRLLEKNIDVPGLTLGSVGNYYSDSIPSYNLKAVPTVEKTIKIWNYGRHRQQISALRLNPGTVGSIGAYRNIIESRMTDSVTVQFTVNDDIIHVDTLFADTKCGSLILAIFRITRSECDISSFEYPFFDNRNPISYNGRAKVIDNFIRLTDADRYRTGSFWHKETVPVLDGFVTEFKFRFINGNNFQCEDGSIPGADGIAFVIQNAGSAAIGYAGGSIGYEGIYNSLAIEFDTFSNDSSQIENYNDPNGNHVAVNTNKEKENSAKHLPGYTLGINKDIIPLRIDSTFYFAKIEYSLKKKTLKVYLDTIKNPSVEILSIENFNISNYLTLDRGYRAYVGFTSATGCAVEAHDICAWTFCPEYPNPETDKRENSISTESRIIIMPNPFNNSTTFRYSNSQSESVRIDIIDLMGFEIKCLHDGFMPQGDFDFQWNPTNIDRGVYFIRVKSASTEIFNKLVFTY